MSRARAGLKPDTRKLIEWAEQYGWTLEGFRGSNHPYLRHKSGAEVTLAFSASDWRTMENCRADIRRISGINEPKTKGPKYRNVSRRRPKFDMQAAVEDQIRWREAKIPELIERIEAKLAYYRLLGEIRTLDPRRDADQARELAEQAAELGRKIA